MSNITVALRVRPSNQGEVGTVLLKPSNIVQLMEHPSSPLEKEYLFDYVWQGGEQSDIYNYVERNIVDSFMSGYNTTLFTYGQTASGKTFTIQGPADKCAYNEQTKGVIPRILPTLFEKINQLNLQSPVLKLSYFEIYNEEIYDLLSSSSKVKYMVLKKEIKYFGLKEEQLSSADKALSIFFGAVDQRRQASTACNEHSSRSHSVLLISLDCYKITNNAICNLKPTMHIIDLAGSERLEKTGNTGEKLKEGNCINLSLTALCKVISQLSSGQGKKFASYRDSLLTLILKNSLGGNSKTMIIVNVSASPSSFYETKSTLVFSQNAKCIKNVLKINETKSQLEEYRKLAEMHSIRREFVMNLLLSSINHKGKIPSNEIEAYLAQYNDSPTIMVKLRGEIEGNKLISQSITLEDISLNVSNTQKQDEILLEDCSKFAQNFNILEKQEMLSNQVAHAHEITKECKERMDLHSTKLCQMEKELCNANSLLIGEANQIAQMNTDYHSLELQTIKSKESIEQYKEIAAKAHESVAYGFSHLANSIKKIETDFRIKLDSIESQYKKQLCDMSETNMALIKTNEILIKKANTEACTYQNILKQKEGEYESLFKANKECNAQMHAYSIEIQAHKQEIEKLQQEKAQINIHNTQQASVISTLNSQLKNISTMLTAYDTKHKLLFSQEAINNKETLLQEMTKKVQKATDDYTTLAEKSQQMIQKNEKLQNDVNEGTKINQRNMLDVEKLKEQLQRYKECNTKAILAANEKYKLLENKAKSRLQDQFNKNKELESHNQELQNKVVEMQNKIVHDEMLYSENKKEIENTLELINEQNKSSHKMLFKAVNDAGYKFEDINKIDQAISFLMYYVRFTQSRHNDITNLV